MVTKGVCEGRAQALEQMLTDDGAIVPDKAGRGLYRTNRPAAGIAARWQQLTEQPKSPFPGEVVAVSRLAVVHHRHKLSVVRQSSVDRPACHTSQPDSSQAPETIEENLPL